MDDTDAPLAKGKTSVLSDPSAIARRKRMEIRKFKKLSRSMQFLHDESLSLENSAVCLKRPRIAQTAMEFIDPSDDTHKNDSLSLILHTEEANFFPLAKDKEPTKLDCVAPLDDTGLLRNKPFSPMKVFSQKAGHSRPDTDIDIGGSIGHPACSLSESLKRQRCVLPAVLPSSEATTRSLSVPSAPLSMVGVVEHLEDGSSVAELVIPLVTAKHGLSSCRVSLESAAAPLGPTVGTSGAEIIDFASRSTLCEGIGSSASLSRDFSRRAPSGCKLPPSGKLLVCGRRREMEDTATIALSFSQIRRDATGSCLCVGELEVRPLCALHFFAVYDGHGGSQASNFCMENLHLVLAKELSSVQEEGKGEASAGLSTAFAWESAMISCFSKMDRDVGGVCPNGVCDDVDSPAVCCSDSIAPENVGTTAVVAIVSLCQIVVANCGDSRAVLSRGGMAIPLSRDHKPNRDDEYSRIEAAGGRVIQWDGHRVGGLLALSRAIGDRYLKRYVISKPEVTCLQRTEEDECLILASDGLWDVISNDTACEIARKCLSSSRKKRDSGDFALGEDPACAAVAALLIKLAYGRGSKDNISAVVIDLKA